MMNGKNRKVRIGAVLMALMLLLGSTLGVGSLAEDAPFTAAVAVKQVNTGDLYFGDVLKLTPDVTEATMGYKVIWEEKQADGTWKEIGTRNEDLRLDVNPDLSARIFRVVLEGDDGNRVASEEFRLAEAPKTREEAAPEEVVEEVAEETAPEEVVEEVTEETAPEEVVEEVAEETAPEEVVEEVTEETAPEEVVEEVAEETVPEEVVEEVAEEAAPEEVVEEVVEEAAPEEVVEEVAEEAAPEEVTEEVVEEAAPEEVTEEVAEEAAPEEVTEEVAEQPAAEGTIIVEETPDEEEKTARKITVHSSLEGVKYIFVGTDVYLTSELEGYDGLEYTAQWMYSEDGGETFQPYPEATGLTFTYKVNKYNVNYLWQLVITVVGE